MSDDIVWWVLAAGILLGVALTPLVTRLFRSWLDVRTTKAERYSEVRMRLVAMDVYRQFVSLPHQNPQPRPLVDTPTPAQRPPGYARIGPQRQLDEIWGEVDA